MNYIYFYPEFVRILVCILIIAGICMQCFAFIYKFNSGAKGFKYVCELSFEFSVILLQFIYGYIYSCIYYQTNISIYYPEQYLAVGYIASILFLIMFIATAVYLKQAHITLSICFALPLLPFANHLANGTFTVVLFTALIMFIIRSVHLILKVSKLKRNTITPLSVKESIDALNTGILFCRNDGQILLANHCISNLMTEIFNKEFTSGIKFINKIRNISNTQNQQTVCKVKNSYYMIKQTEMYIKKKPYFLITFPFCKQQLPVIPELPAPKLSIDFLRLRAPGNSSHTYRYAVSVQKAHLITEKSGNTGKGLFRQSFPVSIISILDEICHFISPERIKPGFPFQHHFSVTVIEPLTPAVREMFQHMAVRTSGGPSVLIIDPEFHFQLSGVQDDFRQNIQIGAAHISGPSRIISGMKNRSPKAHCLHFLKLAFQDRQLQFPVNRPEA